MNKVKDQLPIPKTCRYCGADVQLVDNEKIYGKSYGAWPFAYKCSCCDSYVGVHPNTNIPLGTLANRELREWRKKAKDVFNPLWQYGGMSRTAAYNWLSEKLGIHKSKCHIGWFDVEECKKVFEMLKNYK